MNPPDSVMESCTSVNVVVPTESRSAPLSLMWCLIASGYIIAAETAVDLLRYPFESGLAANPLAAPLAKLLDWAHFHSVYAFGVYWWAPLCVICFAMGYRFRQTGIVYSLCGLIMFLVILHNFRGLAIRHNVFDTADTVRRMRPPGVPQPLGWDALYFAIALLASLAGWGVAMARRPRKEITDVAREVRSRYLAIAAGLCAGLGVAEILVTVLSAVPRGYRHYYAPFTHGEAVFIFGVACILLLRYGEEWFGWQIQ